MLSYFVFCYKKKKNLLGNFLITCVYTYNTSVNFYR